MGERVLILCAQTISLRAAETREGAAGTDTGAGTGAAGVQTDEEDRSFGEGDHH